MAWSPSTSLSSSVATGHDLGAIAYRDDLFLAYIDTGSKIRTDRLTTAGWVGHNTEIYSPKGPSLAVLNDQLYLFWNSGNSEISYAYWDPSSLSWSNQGVIGKGPNEQGGQPETDSSPFGFGFDGRMFMVHRGKTSNLWMSTATASSGTAALAWQGDFELTDSEDDSYSSGHGPTLVAAWNKLYMIYDDDDDLGSAQYSGSAESGQFPSSQSFAGVTDINSVIGVASFGNSEAMTVVAYRDDSDRLMWTLGWPYSFNSPQECWSGQITKIAPALAYYAGQMYLFFGDKDGKLRFATMAKL